MVSLIRLCPFPSVCWYTGLMESRAQQARAALPAWRMKTSSYMLEQDMARHMEQTVAATQGASGWLGVTPPFRWTERFLKKPGGKVLRYHRKEGSLSLLLSFWLGDGQPTFAVWGLSAQPWCKWRTPLDLDEPHRRQDDGEEVLDA